MSEQRNRQDAERDQDDLPDGVRVQVPRCRVGIRSAMATYRKLPAANASTYGASIGAASEQQHGRRAERGRRAPTRALSSERARTRVAGGEQDREVAGLLRDLVRDDGERGRDARAAADTSVAAAMTTPSTNV